MATGGCPKITFDRISDHFRSIRNFRFKFLTKWPLAAILDVRNSLSLAFLAISYRYETFFLIFDKMATGGHFGCPKITFDRIPGHFRSIGHFGCPKFTFDRISGHFRSIYRTFFFRRPFCMFENHFRSHVWPFQIDRPFWVSEIHFRSHFWTFQIDTVQHQVQNCRFNETKQSWR